MPIEVLKFGGTSVGSIERIRNVADKIIKKVDDGVQVVTVVSAMGKTTDELTARAYALSETPDKREMDMLLTTGEQQTMALLAMHLTSRGYPAVSMTGWQAGINTESVHGNARIKAVNPKPLKSALDAGRIVIVAGFQGMDDHGQIMTLGRGGSDTTAVAIAEAVRADVCDIYTDVTGVFTTDPRYVEEARKLGSVNYEEMLELATLGAGVLHPRAVENAMNHNVRLSVRSSMKDEPGTTIGRDQVMLESGQPVQGLAFDRNVVKFTLAGLPQSSEVLSNIFTCLADAGINVDIIIQETGEIDEMNLSFSLGREDATEAKELLTQCREAFGISEIHVEEDLAKISIVGSGMMTNPGVAARMFTLLSEADIDIKMVSTSEIKVSGVIKLSELGTALTALHKGFGLGEKASVLIN